MRPLATAAQMKELDRVAIEERGIPSLDLMECAAQRVAQQVYALVAKEGKNDDPRPRVALFCGTGNNGGDGIAAARLLMERGCTVRTFLVGDRAKMTPDARAMEVKLLAAGGVLEAFDPDDPVCRVWLTTCDCLVDALFGVGLNRVVGGEYRTAIQWINHLRNARCSVVACDIPSGLHADTGAVLGEAVRADVTVTFTFAKPGLYLGEGRACSGHVEVADIGIPFDLTVPIRRQAAGVQALDGGTYVLPRRPRTGHKGTFGKVFILAGSEGYTGAPVLAANAAVRTGAGLVYLAVPWNIYPIVAVKCDEAMPFPIPEDYDAILKKAAACDVALIGPGLGRAPETETLVRRLLADLDIPVVLDADGINALEGHTDILKGRRAATVLTPHDGEFRRLTGCDLPISDRLTAARDFAVTHGCTLVLKGHATVTAAPDGAAWINASGNPGMARGGSGDVLAGMLAALLGQKHLNAPHAVLSERVAVGVHYHGLAGDRCAREVGEYGMTPTDMIAAIPAVLKEHEERHF